MTQLKFAKIPNYKVAIPAISINLGVIAAIFLLQSKLPPVIPIYFGLPRGVEQLGPRSALSLPTLTALAITFISLTLGIIYKDSFLKNVLAGIIIIATILSLISVIKIFSIIGNI